MGAVAVALLATHAGTAGAAAWLHPLLMNASGTAADPDVALAGDGTVAAVWRQDGSSIVTSLRPPAGIFVRKTVGTDALGPPRIAASASGVAVAVWRGTGGIHWVARFPGGGFGTTRTPSSSSPKDPDVAVNANGVFATAWGESDNVHVIVGPAGGTPRDLHFPAVNPSQVAVAIEDAAAPKIAVSWVDDSGNVQGAVSGQAPVTMGSGQHPSVVLDRAGVATAVWDGGGDTRFARGATLPSGSGSVVSVNGSGAPALAGTASGLLAAAFRDDVTGRINLAQRLGGNPFGAVSPISLAGGSSPTVSMSPAGRVAAAWLRGGALEGTVVGVSGAQQLPSSGGATEPVIASDALGDAAAIFLKGGDAFIGVFDGAPPSLNSVSVPPITPSGSPVSMAAAPLDVWTAPSVTWSFGDGQSAAGPTTSHVYAKTGIYTVTVGARDSVGNATSTTRQIAVVFPDRDGDKFPSNIDCNDHNRKIHPGARDIPGDKIDQDCNGRDAKFPKVDASISYSWVPAGAASTRLTSLVVKGANRRETITVSCKRRCTFSRKRISRPRKHNVNVLKRLSARQRVFSAGQTLQVRVSRKRYIAKVLLLTFRAGKAPVQRSRCVRPGSRKLRKRC